MTRLQEHYNTVVHKSLSEEFGYKNPLAVPRLDKILINTGVGEAVQDSKKIEAAAADLALIAGQKPLIIKAKRSVANYKLREGMRIGTKVTLRRRHMYEFLDRLVTIALPRVRDFRGLNPKSFDGRGNFTLGIREQIIFPEVDYDSVEKTTGLNVTVCTTAATDAEAKALLAHLGVPFRQ